VLNGLAPAVEPAFAAQSASFYFVVGPQDASISDQKPTDVAAIHASDSFEEIRDKAVDHLIALVDLLEQRLWQIKRAQDFAEYQGIVDAE